MWYHCHHLKRMHCRLGLSSIRTARLRVQTKRCLLLQRVHRHFLFFFTGGTCRGLPRIISDQGSANSRESSVASTSYYDEDGFPVLEDDNFTTPKKEVHPLLDSGNQEGKDDAPVIDPRPAKRKLALLAQPSTLPTSPSTLPTSPSTFATPPSTLPTSPSTSATPPKEGPAKDANYVTSLSFAYTHKGDRIEIMGRSSVSKRLYITILRRNNVSNHERIVQALQLRFTS